MGDMAEQAPGVRAVRWTGAVILLVLAAVLVTGAVTTRFARSQLLDTDRYVENVAPLATDPAIQEAIVNRITTELVNAIDVPALVQQAAQASDLTRAPAIATLISGPLSDWLEGFIRDRVSAFVHGERFANLWATVNRVAHGQITDILTDQSTAVKIKGDEVVVDLGPVVSAVKDDLVARGFGIVSKVPNVSVTYPIFQSDQLPRIQRAARLLDRLATWLPWLALLVFFGAVWLAPGHRRAALLGCLIVALFMAAALIAYALARNRYEDQIAARNLNVPAASAAYDTVLRFLVHALQTWLVVALIIAVWLYLAGPGRVGRGVRGLLGRGEQFAGDGIARAGWRPTGAARVLRRYARWLGWALGIAAALVLLFVPTVAAAVWLSVGALVLLIAYGILVRIPEADPLPLT
jgi:hypothetical protein